MGSQVSIPRVESWCEPSRNSAPHGFPTAQCGPQRDPLPATLLVVSLCLPKHRMYVCGFEITVTHVIGKAASESACPRGNWMRQDRF